MASASDFTVPIGAGGFNPCSGNFNHKEYIAQKPNNNKKNLMVLTSDFSLANEAWVSTHE